MNEYEKSVLKKREAREKKKKTILIGIVICIVLIIMLAILIMYYQNVDVHTFKLYIDDQQVELGDGFYFTNDSGDTYVRARDIASYIKWSYQNGEYGSFTEDTNSGYIQNKYEIASFVAGSNVLKKYIQAEGNDKNSEQNENRQEPQTTEEGEVIYEVNSVNGTLETTTLDLPIIIQNGQIYFPLKHLSDICNCNVSYDNPYRMYIYEQNFLVNLAQTNAAQFGFQSISGVYENIRTLAYGMMVVSNGSLYGVVDVYDGSDVIGLKYTDMVFAQNVKQFFVKTSTSESDETIGIIDIKGNSVVSPKNYSSMQLLSDELGLYLVGKNEQYGVLNQKGDVIVHCEYDNIGIPESVVTGFELPIEDNKYLLFNNSIIVENEGEYGIYDIEGNQTLPAAYVGFGYLKDSDEDAVKGSESVLTMEIKDLKLSDGSTRDIEAIVVQQTVDEVIKYGVYDAVSKRLILPCNYDRIYGMVSNGNTDYYIEFQGAKDTLANILSQHPEIFE